jgi:hypothetical protein
MRHRFLVVTVMVDSSLEPEGDAERDVYEKLAHSIDDVVALSSVGRTLVFAEIKAGRLIARKCGRRTIILRSDLHRWLKSLSCSQGTDGAPR